MDHIAKLQRANRVENRLVDVFIGVGQLIVALGNRYPAVKVIGGVFVCHGGGLFMEGHLLF